MPLKGYPVCEITFLQPSHAWLDYFSSRVTARRKLGCVLAVSKEKTSEITDRGRVSLHVSCSSTFFFFCRYLQQLLLTCFCFFLTCFSLDAFGTLHQIIIAPFNTLFSPHDWTLVFPQFKANTITYICAFVVFSTLQSLYEKYRRFNKDGTRLKKSWSHYLQIKGYFAV